MEYTLQRMGHKVEQRNIVQWPQQIFYEIQNRRTKKKKHNIKRTEQPAFYKKFFKIFWSKQMKFYVT